LHCWSLPHDRPNHEPKQNEWDGGNEEGQERADRRHEGDDDPDRKQDGQQRDAGSEAEQAADEADGNPQELEEEANREEQRPKSDFQDDKHHREYRKYGETSDE